MKFKKISWLPAVLTMLVIFCFSAQPVIASSKSSQVIVNIIFDLYEKISNTPLLDGIRTQKMEIMEHIVRKGAHFSEYAFLANMIMLHLAVWGRKRKELIGLSILLSTIYAVTDEFHQIFVPGRAGRVSDVLIDASGAIVGTLIFCILALLIQRRNAAKAKKAILLQ
ncbi:MAG: VanZ family protein [Mobilitalea sp.]